MRIIRVAAVLVIAGSIVWIGLLLWRAAGDTGPPVLIYAGLTTVGLLTGVGIIMAARSSVSKPHGTLDLMLAAAALGSLALAACAQGHQTWLRTAIARLFGPPAVQSKEIYERREDGLSFDHSTFDALLKKHVDDAGWVDYKGFARDAEALQAYITSIGEAPFVELDRDEKLALLINAYNAFTIQLILEYMPIDSIRDIPESKRWDDVRWTVGGNTWSLNQIEHEQIRPKFEEPLIHFALVCAAESCPPLRAEAYTADKLDDQLREQAEYAHRHDRWLRVDGQHGIVHMTELYNWYGDDFVQASGSVLTFAAKYNDDLAALLKENPKPTIRWIPYSWKLNSIENRPDVDD